MAYDNFHFDFCLFFEYDINNGEKNYPPFIKTFTLVEIEELMVLLLKLIPIEKEVKFKLGDRLFFRNAKEPTNSLLV